ncbi:MAG TPA: hypothetical protein VNU01_05485 [Egibacteraceae bacterium]|nr:hypothetical protein [Egibacteraceae bacterium]
MRRFAVVLAVLAATACQPVDDVPRDPRGTVERVTETPLDAPVTGMPSSLEDLRARAWPEALAWQDEPVLAEILVDVEASGGWRRAQLTYLAADADRLLTVTVTADGMADELTTLAALQLHPVSRRGMAEVPELPEGVLQPPELVRMGRAELRECGIRDTPTGVLYASGAPAAWNGRRWTAPPVWTATVTSDGGAVQLDPVSGEVLGCVEAGA